MPLATIRSARRFSTGANTRLQHTRCLRWSASLSGWTSPPLANWRVPMRSVLVTGGSRGIGLAITRRLAASGNYNVIAVARRESEDLIRAIRETGADRLHFRAF